MHKITITSLNINGFNHSTSALTKFITRHHCHVTCLQETHTIDHMTLQHFKNNNNYHVFTNSDCTNNQSHHSHAGTAIIVNTSLFGHTSCTFHNNNIAHNRIQSLTICFSKFNVTVFNLYLPSGHRAHHKEKRKYFINVLMNKIKSINLNRDFIIVTGDFNFVPKQLDRTGNFNYNSCDKIVYRKFINSFNFIDVFRLFQPATRLYTFIRKNYASRLDRIYIQHAARSHILKFEHFHLSFSDHCLAPSITLKLSSVSPSKPNYWKLNDSILQCPDTLSNINYFFTHILSCFSLSPDPYLCWENLKTLFKKHLIFISKRKNLNRKWEKLNLQQQLEEANNKKDFNTIFRLNQQLEQFEKFKEQGNQIRAKEPPFRSIDEPPPLSSLNEIKSQSRLTIPPSIKNPLIPEDPNQTSKQSFFTFFNSLWGTSPNTPNPTQYLLNIHPPPQETSSPEYSDSPFITPEEVKLAIKLLNKNSSPGSDGFTSSFYQSLPILVPKLVEIFNNSFLRKSLPPSQLTALVKLIPKIRSPTLVTHYRPISLLNTDYKILSHIISNRLKPLLNHIISPEQQCGLPGRQIFHNHLNIKSAIDLAIDFGQPLAIVQIDFYKAFDSLSHSFLLAVAEKLGIPSDLLKWIRIFLTNLRSQLLINGCPSDFIAIKRGIRQGCPLSMLLFILGSRTSDSETSQLNPNPRNLSW